MRQKLVYLLIVTGAMDKLYARSHETSLLRFTPFVQMRKDFKLQFMEAFRRLTSTFSDYTGSTAQ